MTFFETYYLVPDQTITERARSSEIASAVLETCKRLRAEGRAAVVLYWPDRDTYTIAAEQLS